MNNEHLSKDESLNNSSCENENEWNIVDNQPTPSNEENIPLGSISQSIIVGTLNNRLNEISLKMDTIITKLDNLDNRIKNLEEFAKCADWEIAGGYTLVDGKRIKDEGLLEKFDVNIKEARNLIMKARLEMGWISKEDYEKELSD